MTDIDTREYESVYIAGTVREANAVEALFGEQEIEFEMRPANFYHTISLNGPFAGVSFCVLGGQAWYSRRLLAERGFTKGIVTPEQA